MRTGAALVFSKLGPLVIRQLLLKLMKLSWQSAVVGLTDNGRREIADSESRQLSLAVFIYRKAEKQSHS